MKVAVLFSGEASSICSLNLIRKAGVEVGYLVTAKAPQSSRMYSNLDPDLTRISAQSMGFSPIEFVADSEDEISPLIEALEGLDIDGLCDGVVASNRRRNRLLDVCKTLEIQLVLPLWHKDPAEILTSMIEEGFEIMIVRLRSDRLDGSWLGQALNRRSLEEFLRACVKSEISPMGESGEFETFVMGGPGMRGRIELDLKRGGPRIWENGGY